MKHATILIPALLGATFLTGCAVGPGTYGSGDNSSYVDQAAINSQESSAQNDQDVNAQLNADDAAAGAAAPAAATAASANP